MQLKHNIIARWKVVAVFACLAATACVSEPTANANGVLYVGNSAFGSGAVDSDGFVVTIDGQAQFPNLGVNATVTYTLAPGTYSVGISGLASNCVVDPTHATSTGPNPQNAVVAAGNTKLVSFAIRCD